MEAIKISKKEKKEITHLTNKIYDLFANGEITASEFVKVCDNLGYIIAQYFIYRNENMPITETTIINNFLRG